MEMSNSLVYKTQTNGRIKIAKEPLERMLTYRQYNGQILEAGGLLVGRYIVDCNDIIIDNISVPMDKDIRRRYFFKKDTQDHQRYLKEYWVKSNMSSNYIGEWHTHPEFVPQPSVHDFTQWRKVLKETHTFSDTIFFIIVGVQSIKVWQGFCSNLNIIELFTE